MNLPFAPLLLIERKYQNALVKLLKDFIPPFKNGHHADEWIAQLADLSNHQALQTMSNSVASSMVQWVNIQNARSWKEAAARAQRSRMFYRLQQAELEGPIGVRYNQIIRENAELIRSIPSEVAERLNNHLAKAQQMGSRPETIARVMRANFPKLAKWKISTLARTGVSSASSSLTRAKSEQLGIPAYVWRTSEDQRVRHSHRKMDDTICLWSEPPAPEQLVGKPSTLGHYMAGQCPQCRCYPEPILRVDDLAWPHRVYRSGSVRVIPRAEFVQLFRGYVVQAA